MGAGRQASAGCFPLPEPRRKGKRACEFPGQAFSVGFFSFLVKKVLAKLEKYRHIIYRTMTAKQETGRRKVLKKVKKRQFGKNHRRI
jgi:hypothetical protein